MRDHHLRGRMSYRVILSFGCLLQQLPGGSCPKYEYDDRFAEYVSSLYFFNILDHLDFSYHSLSYPRSWRGGIVNLSLIIVSDLVPLSQRGLFQGLLFLAFSIANAIGPPIVRKSSSILGCLLKYSCLGWCTGGKGVLEMALL